MQFSKLLPFGWTYQWTVFWFWRQSMPLSRFLPNVYNSCGCKVYGGLRLETAWWWLVFIKMRNQHAQLVRHYSHIGCIYLTFPHCVLNRTLWWLVFKALLRNQHAQLVSVKSETFGRCLNVGCSSTFQKLLTKFKWKFPFFSWSGNVSENFRQFHAKVGKLATHPRSVKTARIPAVLDVWLRVLIYSRWIETLMSAAMAACHMVGWLLGLTNSCCQYLRNSLSEIFAHVLLSILPCQKICRDLAPPDDKKSQN